MFVEPTQIHRSFAKVGFPTVALQRWVSYLAIMFVEPTQIHRSYAKVGFPTVDLQRWVSYLAIF